MAWNCKNISCGLINMQSICNKTIKLRNMINEQNFDICMISETWLSSSIADSSKIKESTPKSHNFFHIPRENQVGGGVGIFISKSYPHVTLKNQHNFVSFEHIDCTISIRNKNLRIITLYRPPRKSKRLFLDEFGLLLDSLNELNNVLICGDFNFHINDVEDSYVIEFLEILDTHDLFNSVNKPTSLSNNIIDLVISHKNTNIVKNIEVEPQCSISPMHKLIKFDTNIERSNITRKEIIYREKKNFNAVDFITESVSEVENSDFSCGCGDAVGLSGNDNDIARNNECSNCYTEKYRNVFSSNYNKRCPKIQKNIKIRDSAKWFNSDLLEAKRVRRKMEDKWKRSKTDENWLCYTNARNKYNYMVEKAKKNHYNTLFAQTKDSKSINRNLDNLLGLKKEKILPENKGDPPILANNFAIYFEEKIDKICTSLENQNAVNVSYIPRVEQGKLEEFEEITICDIKRIMSKSKYTNCENDPFPIADVKDAGNIHLLQELYKKMVNMSITNAIFPQTEKLACIKPSYKGKGDKNDLSSYRPISNLSYLSKIIEIVVNEQIGKHLEKTSAIPENQSAYRENHSTETTICATISDMIEITDNERCGILVMLDLSAAFDTVDHDDLLDDLMSIGVGGEAHKWFKSYLQKRSVTVIVSNCKSETGNLTRGVPQGSILGPILFNIYTIELSWILKKHNVKFKLYADDTQFYFAVTSAEEAKNKITTILNDVRDWMIKKKLKLNENKTECMLFGTANGLKNYENFHEIQIGSSTVKIVNVVKDLGIDIDNTLSMKSQILKTIKICNHHIKNISFIRKYLNQNTLKNLISSHVMSRLDYCNSIYYGLPNYLLKKLQNVQNRAARLVKGTRLIDRITPVLIDLHWLPMKARIEYKICLLVFKALLYQRPVYLKEYLHPFELDTSIIVRHASEPHRLQEPRERSKIAERAFRNCAPRLYNKLPSELKSITDVTLFKKKLKTFIFSECYDTQENKVIGRYKL